MGLLSGALGWTDVARWSVVFSKDEEQVAVVESVFVAGLATPDYVRFWAHFHCRLYFAARPGSDSANVMIHLLQLLGKETFAERGAAPVLSIFGAPAGTRFADAISKPGRTYVVTGRAKKTARMVDLKAPAPRTVTDAATASAAMFEYVLRRVAHDRESLALADAVAANVLLLGFTSGVSPIEVADVAYMKALGLV